MGLSGVSNGKLLAAAEAAKFDVLLTGDKGMAYQNNLTGRHIAVVALSAVSWNVLKGRIAEVQRAVDRAVPGSFVAVECGAFLRPRRKSRGPSL